MQSTYAVLGTAPRTLELRTRDLTPADDQVLVRLHACGICRGDLLDFAQPRAEVAAFGHEPVGQVVACGSRVQGLQEGDWVVGGVEGGFATHALAQEDWLYRIPAELAEYGGLAEPLKCIMTIVRAAAPDYGDTVAVVGCGFMGLAAIAALGKGWAGQVVAVDTEPVRRALALELGATHAVDPLTEEAPATLQALTAGRGADVAIDLVGNVPATTLAARLLRTRGRLIAAAGYLPQDEGMALYLKALTLHCTPPSFSCDPGDDWRRTLAAMETGRFPLDRLLTHRFPLSGIQGAFETALQGAAAGYLKGVVVNDLGE